MSRILAQPAQSAVVAGAALPFLVRADAGLWTGIEQALDNGFGCLFIVDADGVLLGATTLADLAAAIREGAHLGSARLGAFAGLDLPDTVRPVVDAAGRLVDVRLAPEARVLPVAEPDLSHAELRNLLEAFLSTWISSSGDFIRSFEARFAARIGMAEGVATSNGTVSLHLALAALGLGPGDEVIVPDLTFAASANAVLHVGATPVLVDVDPESWCLSAEGIASALTPRTRAVMPVHVFGRPAPMTEIAALARRHGIFIVEDCAEAHGARVDGRAVGAFSDVASFSFFANKIVTTGEGGICLTDDPAIAARLRLLRDHGMAPGRRYWHEEVGFNFRMTNMQAAIGCAQLDRMDDFLAMRRGVDALYRETLADVPGLLFPPPMDRRFEPVVWFSSVLVPAESRASLIAAAAKAHIDLRPFFHGLSSMPAYAHLAADCPVSRGLSASGANLPTSRKVDRRMAERIAGIFRDVLG